MNTNSNHQPVLLKETLDLMQIHQHGIYVDGTLGFGGHTLAILKKLNKTGHLYCFEQDEAVMKQVKKILQNSPYKNFTLINSNFRNLQYELAKQHIYQIDGLLLDLGLSSWHFDKSERGFSYKTNTKLDMRLNQDHHLTAYDIVNYYDTQSLCDIFFKYGDERFAKAIVRQIIAYRNTKPIVTTFDLNNIIKSTLPQAVLKKRKHPSKKVFQALRIKVNEELQVLRAVLEQSVEMLKIKGRMAVITFHSGEDKILKAFFREMTQNKKDDLSLRGTGIILLKPTSFNFKDVTRNKVVVPSASEVEMNRRAHSSKLRVLSRVK